MIKLFVLMLLPLFAATQQNKVILAVFAHPDDESSVSPVLAKYAAAGATVYLAIATDGRYGVTAHYPVRDPDSLAAVRTAEINCTASTLGIRPPILLKLHDQLHMKDGMDSINLQLSLIRNWVTDLFTSLKPDAVITWGPSGLTNHPDHRAVSDAVTEVFTTKVWQKPADLFYTALASGTIGASRFGLATVDKSFLNVRISVTKSETTLARRAWDCHKSQYTREVTDELESFFWTSQKGIFYFRSFRNPIAERTTLFGQ